MAEDLTVTRMGYGAMQLAGPYVFGPPADRNAAVSVLHGFGHGEVGADNLLRDTGRSAKNGRGLGGFQPDFARAPGNRQSAEDARSGAGRRAGAAHAQERDYPSRPHAALGAVRHLLIDNSDNK